MKKICFLLTSLESGGAENYLLRFLEFLGESNEVTIICKGGKGGSLEGEFKKLGARIILKKLGYFNIKNFIAYKNLLNKNFDAVCDFTGNFGGLPMLISKWNRIPIRIAFYRASSHRFNPNLLKTLYSDMMKRLVNRYSTAILSNSLTAFQFFFSEIHARDKRFQVIKNGVNLELFSRTQNKDLLREKYNLPKDAYLIGHVGRWNPAKNYPTLFKVAKELIVSQKGSNKIAFVFCGRETNSIFFKKILEEYDIADECYCLGEQKQVNEVLRCFDLFYFPSVTEGQPNALIEAMVSGLPFIASNISAIKETVPNEALKQLVPPLDVEVTIKKIHEAIYNASSFTHVEWAKIEYHSKRRFEEFKNVLITTENNESHIGN